MYKNYAEDSYEIAKAQENIDEIFTTINQGIVKIPHKVYLSQFKLDKLSNIKVNADRWGKFLEKMLAYADGREEELFTEKLNEIKELDKEYYTIYEAARKHNAKRKGFRYIMYFLSLIPFVVFYYLMKDYYMDLPEEDMSYKYILLFWIAIEVITVVISDCKNYVIFSDFTDDVIFTVITSLICIAAVFIVVYFFGGFIKEGAIYNTDCITKFKVFLIAFGITHLINQKIIDKVLQIG